jgi:hypothetical protein
MAKTFATPNREILEAALQGLETQRQRLDEQISQVRRMMGQRTARPSKASAAEASTDSAPASSRDRKRRILSPEARKRIAAAQKKRWATFRKNQG